MPGEVGSIKYSLREPFGVAFEAVCGSLRKQGLRVSGQLDVSRRVEQALEIALLPCQIIFVLPNLSR
jgi:hypothetical protein